MEPLRCLEPGTRVPAVRARLARNVIITAALRTVIGRQLPLRASGDMPMRMALACLFLAGCASHLDAELSDPEQLQRLSTTGLCKPYLRSESVALERQRRGLGDCSSADQACVKAGYHAESPGYALCRAEALSRGEQKCYFTGPANGRPAHSLANADLICSGPAK
jgi:hypothetical protein